VQETTEMHKRYVKELPLANPQDVFTNGEIRYDELSKRSLPSGAGTLTPNVHRCGATCTLVWLVGIRLDELDVMGFDYDYTLASYTDKVSYFIYDKALQYLLKNHW
jgi:hypothetical protein